MYIIRAVAPLHYACATITAGKEVKAKGKENATKAPRAEPAAKKQRQGKRVNTGKKGAQGKGKPGPQKPITLVTILQVTEHGDMSKEQAKQPEGERHEQLEGERHEQLEGERHEQPEGEAHTQLEGELNSSSESHMCNDKSDVTCISESGRCTSRCTCAMIHIH
jgi:hypothetical protein